MSASALSRRITKSAPFAAPPVTRFAVRSRNASGVLFFLPVSRLESFARIDTPDIQHLFLSEAEARMRVRVSMGSNFTNYEIVEYTVTEVVTRTITEVPKVVKNFVDFPITRSSLLTAVRYDNALQLLQVEFKEGTTYEYTDVSRVVAGGFLLAPSMGNYYTKNIRNLYPCTKVTK